VLQQAVQQASEGKFRLKVEQGGIDELRQEIRASARKRDATIVAAATLLGGLVWLALGAAPWPGVALCAAGLLALALARQRGRE